MQLTERKSKRLMTEPMRWLFAAFFEDNTVILQDQKDKGKNGGSRFTDVLKHDSNLLAFEIRHVDGDKTITVDLKTGNFIVNGIPLQIHDQHYDPTKHDLKLIYFRETRMDTHSLGTVQMDGSVTYEDIGEPRHYVNRYFIGWETDDNKVTMAVG